MSFCGNNLMGFGFRVQGLNKAMRSCLHTQDGCHLSSSNPFLEVFWVVIGTL